MFGFSKNTIHYHTVIDNEQTLLPKILSWSSEIIYRWLFNLENQNVLPSSNLCPML